MDMVLMVVESERTNRDVVTRAHKLLAESKAKISVVLNKTRNYIPRQLQQEM
jgi:CO dehydrogenase nickel-insertion accessory protein CooC1